MRNRQADESDRLLAAELAGDFTVVNDELADALLSILRSDDEPDALRAQAAISFGPALETADEGTFDGDPEEAPITDDTFIKIKRVLQGLFMDIDVPKEVRRRVLEAAVRAPQDWHRPAISSAYTNSDPEWKLSAVFCMRFVRGFDDQISEALDSEDLAAYGNHAERAAVRIGERIQQIANHDRAHTEQLAAMLAATEDDTDDEGGE